MPLVRIGEALLSLGLIDDSQLKEALVQQQLDRSVPLGEVLVRMGVVSREDLQTALARKMGYPLVDLDAFPVEAEALRKLRYGVAARLRVMPLLVRDGRLVVALDDPSRRAAVDEVEFNAEHEGGPGARAAPVDRRPPCTPPTTRSARRARRTRPTTWRRRSPTSPTSPPPPRPRRRRPTSSSRRSRRRASSDWPARRRQADRAERQLARPPAQQHGRRGAQGRRLRHPHRELPRQGEDPRPLPEGRHPAHLPRAAGELPQRADRARQDHVRSRHLRAQAPAGRQDQLRQVRAAAQDRAARRDDPDQQRPRGRRPAPARLGAADPDRHARPDRAEPAGAAGRRSSAPTAWCCASARPARARRRRCTRRSATSTCRSARSGPPRIRSRSPSRACARCR